MPAFASSARFRLALAAVAALSTALPALALPAQAQTQPQRTTQPVRTDAQMWRALSTDTLPTDAPRVVLVCEQGAIARRNFERRFGQSPLFITADQALAARDRNDVWSTPRCMTQRQMDRLIQRLD